MIMNRVPFLTTSIAPLVLIAGVLFGAGEMRRQEENGYKDLPEDPTRQTGEVLAKQPVDTTVGTITLDDLVNTFTNDPENPENRAIPIDLVKTFINNPKNREIAKRAIARKQISSGHDDHPLLLLLLNELREKKVELTEEEKIKNLLNQVLWKFLKN